MISHVSIGVHEVEKAGHFYDAVLGALGYKKLYDSTEAIGYGDDIPKFWLMKAAHPVPANPESGLHFCFEAKKRSDVDQFHAAALKASGKDNGKPGLRPDYGDNYYAAFVVDPEGYRIEAYCGR